jgi:hypothetical protein
VHHVAISNYENSPGTFNDHFIWIAEKIMQSIRHKDTEDISENKNPTYYLSKISHKKQRKQIQWPESMSELYRPSDHCLSEKLVPTFADRGCHVVSVMDPYSHNLDFLDWSRYFFFQEAPQLYSWGWEDHVPDLLLFRKSGSTGNRTQTSGSVARNSDH